MRWIIPSIAVFLVWDYVHVVGGPIGSVGILVLGLVALYCLACAYHIVKRRRSSGRRSLRTDIVRADAGGAGRCMTEGIEEYRVAGDEFVSFRKHRRILRHKHFGYLGCDLLIDYMRALLGRPVDE